MAAASFFAKISSLLKKIPTRIWWMLGGAAAGFIFGIPGIIIGIVLGYFLGALAAQFFTDRSIRDYFENGGAPRFSEGEAGLAAFCGLGAYLLFHASPKVLADETAAARIAGGAAQVFPSGKKIAHLAESFSRLAFARASSLNPYILTETLASRRASFRDLPLLASELSSMAIGRDAENEALRIRRLLDPSWQPPPADIAMTDPWTVLDIPRGSSKEDAKKAFRRLALVYHPDNQQGLTDEERELMTVQFIRIRDAYRELTKG